MKIVEMVFVRLVDVPDGWRNRGDPNKVNEQSKRLTTQVVFTAAIYEISLTCSVLSWSYCTERASVRSVFGVVCPRKLLKERAVEQGVTRPLCSLGSLFLIFHSAEMRSQGVFARPYHGCHAKPSKDIYNHYGAWGSWIWFR